MADFDFSTLITDRSQSDVETARELTTRVENGLATAEEIARWNLAAEKGAYNYTDLNRVTACMDYLNEVLTGLGYVTGYAPVEVPHSGGGRLPDGYTQLEYIESTGLQYIDTGIKPNDTTRVIFDCSFSSQSSAAWLFGARAGTYVNTYNFLTVNGLYRSDYGNGSGGTPFDFSADRFEIDKNGPFTYINGQIKDQSTEQEFHSSLNLYLFANNSNGATQGMCKAKGFGQKIYTGGILVRNYIPCKNKDGVPGFYDVVNGEFSASNGTEPFVAGPEIVPDPEPEPLDPYTWYEEDVPTASTMTGYLANVSALREALTLPENTAEVPADMAGLTLTEANNIEQILEAINDYLTAMQAVFLHSGMVWAISGGSGYYFEN